MERSSAGPQSCRHAERLFCEEVDVIRVAKRGETVETSGAGLARRRC